MRVLEADRRPDGPPEPGDDPARVAAGGTQLAEQLLRPGGVVVVRLLGVGALVCSAGHVALLLVSVLTSAFDLDVTPHAPSSMPGTGGHAE
ncbi:hypothetical protein Scel_01680 [Streptomyces cellostaticus]|nr:hypothetical protein Scel_01680 [Streptomyces cellostaticus]